MALQKIISTDKLNSGWREKFNNNVDEVPISFTDNEDGTGDFNKSGGGKIEVDLTGSFYTKSQLGLLPFSGDIASGQFTGNSINIEHKLGSVFVEVALYYASGAPVNPVNFSYTPVDIDNISLTIEEGPSNYHIKVKL
jgi:hypothetical protein